MQNNSLKDFFDSSDLPLILDGAIGSLIQQKGFQPDQHLWYSYINFKYPDVLKIIHQEYIDAGCNIITSNTFRTNPITIKKAGLGLDISEAVKQSMKISREIADINKIFLAGSNPPAEDCYQVNRTVTSFELDYNHKKHIELLYQNGADFILNETQSHSDEIKLICKYCSENSIPFCISVYFGKNLNILSGEPVKEIIEEIKTFEPDVILVNCINQISFIRFIDNIDISFNWGFYLNCGSGDVNDKIIECGLDEHEYKTIVKNNLKYRPKIIGACCGSGPAHIKGIAEVLNE